MRRIRCPFCLSINTAHAMSTTREGKSVRFFEVCDDCDQSWSTDKNDEWYHVPAEKKKKAKRV